MAKKNLENLRTLYAAWAEGDFSAGISLFDRDVVLLIDPGIFDGGTYEGEDGVRDYTTRFLEPWDRLTIVAESFEEAGDVILTAVRQRATGSGSGVPADMRYFQLWEFRGDRVVRLESLLSEEEARRKAGLAG